MPLLDNRGMLAQYVNCSSGGRKKPGFYPRDLGCRQGLQAMFLSLFLIRDKFQEKVLMFGLQSFLRLDIGSDSNWSEDSN